MIIAGRCAACRGWSSRPKSSASVRIHFVAEFAQALQLVDEGAAADAEGLGGFGAVEVVFAQGLDDGLSFDFLQALGVERFDGRRLLLPGARAGAPVVGA